MDFKGINLKKFGIILLVLLAVGVCFSDYIEAFGVEVKPDSNKTYVCYDRSNGNFIGTASSASGCKSQGYGQTSVKLIDDVYAYCVNWKLKYYSNSSYVVDDSWKINSKNAIMAGYVINKVNSQGFSSNKAYGRTGAALNTFFADNVNDKGSYDYSSNSEISGYLNDASSYYNSIKGYLTTSLPSPTLTTSNSGVLNYDATNGKYFSGKINISGLVANYGGSNDIVSYTITARASDGSSVDLCTNANGTGCKTGSVDISNRSSDYSFYIFVSGNETFAGKSIVVSIKGNNKSTYYSSILYDDKANDDAQKLLKITDYTISRTVNKSVTLTAPDLVNHRIHAYKVDENGDNLEGATLEIYKGDTSGSPVATNNGNGYDVTYSTPMVAEGNDDFFNFDYYLVEKKAPSGYIVNSSPIKIFEKGTTNSGATLTCYLSSDNGSLQAVNEEYCYPERYVYKCKHPSTSELIDVDASGNCPIIPNEGLEPNGSSDGGVVETQGSDQNVNTEAIGDEIYDVMAAYTKVCYNKEKSQISEVDYCSNKGSYTKVWNGGNGNISIKKPNTKNLVKISKKDITGDKEIVGASLKVCASATYRVDGNNCVAAKTVDGVSMSWISDEVAHSIYGLAAGDYYIVEVTPPNGYIQAKIATEFSINEKGEVTTGGKTITYNDFVANNSSIVIENTLSEFSISKKDITTSKELPGATISICRTYKNDEGESSLLVDQYTGDCVEAVLADGTVATWKSGNEAKIIRGLASGTYYLVERIAPTDYSTAESILFTLNSDGTVSDSKGNNISDKKIVMYDEPLVNKKTGNISMYIVIGVLVGCATIGVLTYMYLRKVGIFKKRV